MPSVLEIRPTLNTTGSAGQQNTSLGSWPVGNCRKFQLFSFILKIPMSSCTMKYPNCPFTDVFWHPKEWDPLTFTNDPDPPALQLHFLFHALHLIQARCQCKAADPREENHGPWSFFGWPSPIAMTYKGLKVIVVPSVLGQLCKAQRFFKSFPVFISGDMLSFLLFLICSFPLLMHWRGAWGSRSSFRWNG